jgi:hypothetical protein
MTIAILSLWLLLLKKSERLSIDYTLRGEITYDELITKMSSKDIVKQFVTATEALRTEMDIASDKFESTVQQ